MPNFKIWIKEPYPFQWEEQKSIEEALSTTYGCGEPCYFNEWHVHSFLLKGVTITTAKQIASALKFLHRQAAIRDRRYDSRRVEAEDCEVEVRGIIDERPDWANQPA